ncbi:Arm DNA-binding domain-containing protein [Polaromonas jejuensis]|uniref:Integrase arm-type DNA-binding domain-containing protein n=1 Tax=Polaromonas jejuensis TaxID=457502 RepID=A0ABW0Q8A5_9BURK|nr:Arm DNA-binding domain-containing protein [Polaromonas jejuensis]
MPLTDTACKNAKCPGGKARERFTDASGLYLEVVPTGGKHWRWKYRFDGKEKRLVLGSYPQISLATARRAREEAREQPRRDIDPVAAKKEAKQTVKVSQENNFEAVARAWFEHWKEPKSSSRKAQRLGFLKRRWQRCMANTKSCPRTKRRPLHSVLPRH